MSVVAQKKIFPIAAVINDCKLSGLRQHRFIPLQIWTSEVSNEYEGAKLASPGGSRQAQGIRSLLLLASLWLPTLWLLSTWLHLLSAFILCQFPLTFLPSSCKDPCDYTGLTWIIQDPLLSQNPPFLQSPFCYKVTFTASRHWDVNIFGVPLFILSHSPSCLLFGFMYLVIYRLLLLD